MLFRQKKETFYPLILQKALLNYLLLVPLGTHVLSVIKFCTLNRLFLTFTFDCQLWGKEKDLQHLFLEVEFFSLDFRF